MPGAAQNVSASQTDSPAPHAPGAAEALAAVERVVRWEDRVSAQELQLFAAAYVRVLELATAELTGSSTQPGAELPHSAAAPLSALPAAQARTQLLALRVEACARVRQLARARASDAPRTALRAPLMGVALGALCMLLGVSIACWDRAYDRVFLHVVSHDRPWIASSTLFPDWPQSGRLGRFSAPYFFHTRLEEQPWLEIDLGRALEVRSATLVNRTDCCQLRALPIVIEASADHKSWRVGATRSREFATWRARLGVGAVRWVRVRVLRASSLHLKAVTIRA